MYRWEIGKNITKKNLLENGKLLKQPSVVLAVLGLILALTFLLSNDLQSWVVGGPSYEY